MKLKNGGFWSIVLIKNRFFSWIFYSLLDFCIFACWRIYFLGLYLHLNVFWEDPFIHWHCAHVRFSSLSYFLSGWYPFNCVGLWLSALHILQGWTFSGNSLPENISPVWIPKTYHWDTVWTENRTTGIYKINYLEVLWIMLQPKWDSKKPLSMWVTLNLPHFAPFQILCKCHCGNDFLKGDKHWKFLRLMG